MVECNRSASTRKNPNMKSLLCFAATILFASLPALAQTANPVVASANEIYARQSKFIVAAFEEMPADKYNYHPTPAQMSFGKLAVHLIGGNNAVCAMLTATPAPTGPKLTETDAKETLVAAVKASFTYCDQAMAGLQDSQLGDTVTFFRGAQKPRARALMELVADLEDHYSQMAGYLRLNGMTPPSAAPKK